MEVPPHQHLVGGGLLVVVVHGLLTIMLSQLLLVVLQVKVDLVVADKETIHHYHNQDKMDKPILVAVVVLILILAVLVSLSSPIL